MKLRLHQNTARLRLDRDEVARFGAQVRVHGETRFGPSLRLTYALEVSPHAEAIGVRTEGDGFTVLVPAALAREWIETDRVGFTWGGPVGGGEVFRLTVEKDFRCLHRDGPAEAAAFPHLAAPPSAR